MTDGGSESVIHRHCEFRDEETEWTRVTTTFFGEGYRCDCARHIIPLGEVN